MPRRKSAAQVKAECPTCNPQPPDPNAIPVGQPGNRVCQICGGHEAVQAELKGDIAWTTLPPIRRMGKRQPDVCVFCQDDITMLLRDDIDAYRNQIDGLEQNLSNCRRLLGVVGAEGSIHP